MASSDRSSHHGPRGCLIVEDRLDTQAWLRGVVVAAAFPDMSVAVAGSLREARSWLDAYPAGVDWTLEFALIDLGLPDGSGVDLVRRMAATHPDSLPVVATIYDDDAHLFDSIAAGAKGYILKDEPKGRLVDILRRIENGEPPLSPSIAHRILAYFRPTAQPRPDDAGLTSRETEVLTLLARGLTVAEAAATLSLRPQTVASYVKNVYHKLNVSNRAEATLAAAHRGLT